MQQNVKNCENLSRKKAQAEAESEIKLSREDFEAYKKIGGFFMNVNGQALLIPTKYVSAFGYSYGMGKLRKANFPSSNFQDKLRKHKPAEIRFLNNGIEKIKDKRHRVAFQLFMQDHGLIKNSVYSWLTYERILAVAGRANFIGEVSQN